MVLGPCHAKDTVVEATKASADGKVGVEIASGVYGSKVTVEPSSL